jgi:hypothetical protein
MIHFPHKFLAATAVTAVVVGAPTAAFAAAKGPGSPASLSAIQAQAASAISLRESDLASALTEVQSNTVITSADRSTLEQTLQSDESGLTTLGQKIQADTTVTQAASDYRLIFTQYRVFALALPQVRFAAAADDMTGGVLPALTDAQSNLQALLSGPDSSKNTANVQAWMADLSKQISAISSTTSGLSAQVLAITPSQFDSNKAILAQPKATLFSAHADAVTARADIANVGRPGLKGSHDAHRHLIEGRQSRPGRRYGPGPRRLRLTP